MKNHTVRFVYANIHHTQKGTMMVCGEPHRYEKITPGASTVAKFKTLILMVLEDFSSSQTERQVNALIMSCLFCPPNLLTIGVKPTKRLGVNGGMDALVLCIRYNPPNYPIAKIQLFFQTKERK